MRYTGSIFIVLFCVVCSFDSTPEKPEKIINAKVRTDSIQDSIIKYQLVDGSLTWDIKVFEFDSCEYFFVASDYHGGPTHKGNCKYCAARKAKADSIMHARNKMTATRSIWDN
ncbi:MAG: hypothetical protein PHF86_12620 [Candidatus Nanoarchaeia archaeon]|jgi:hypothetical protein|nr:hypothetical protein [Candidatus Nanoarchaeia archaeon]